MVQVLKRWLNPSKVTRIYIFLPLLHGYKKKYGSNTFFTVFFCLSLQLWIWRWISLELWDPCHHNFWMTFWSVSFFHVYIMRYPNRGAKHQPDYPSNKLADKFSHIYFTTQSCGEVHNASSVKSHFYKTPNHPRYHKSLSFNCLFIISTRRCKWKARCYKIQNLDT